jgi:hypothetical protein
MRVECHDMGEDTAEREALGQLAARRQMCHPMRSDFRTSPRIRCSSASVFSRLSRSYEM